ncbi:TetR/AcrR family transcriptional regulator [Embleya sp. NPDC020886]|uniref:TetR/AcrR family transcriptional regulator n=1 Tax=Embleya sp. NPDC020886 TaxID=3363980 RepID=UPI0037885148
MTASAKPRSPGRPRRTAAFLNPDLILDTAIAVIERDGPDALTFRRLGADLGADHTSVLRHFGNKDDLLLALSARLIEDALRDFAPAEHWRATLTDLARRIRDACLAHPAVAVLVAARTSRRDPEFRAADTVVGALFEAGLEGREAAMYYRVLADLGLAMGAFQASYLAMDKEAQEGDELAWRREYLAASPARYPNLALVAPYLADLDDEDQFDTAIELILDAIELRALRARGHEPTARPGHAGR